MNIWILAGVSITYLFVGFLYAKSRTPLSASRLNAILYLTSLAATITAMAISAAAHVGLIDRAGHQMGPRGELIMKTLSFFSDIASDWWIALSVPMIVLVPQALTYLFGLPFGISAKPRYGVNALNFATWTVAKGLGTAAGIVLGLLVLALFGQVQLPVSMQVTGVAMFATLFSWAVGIVAVRFFALEVLVLELQKLKGIRLHKFAIRNRDAESDRESDMVTFLPALFERQGHRGDRNN